MTEISEGPPPVKVPPQDRWMLIKVYAVEPDSYQCHCGLPAELYITTQPDGEPGAVCYAHGLPWIELQLAVLRNSSSISSTQ